MTDEQRDVETLALCITAASRQMIMLRTGFGTKLIFTSVCLLSVVVVLGVLLLYSIDRHNYHLKRIALSHGVLSSYQAVSDHTFRKLNAMGEIVASGKLDDLPARFANEQALREALQRVRHDIAAEVAYIGDEAELNKLDHLVVVERLAERIIAGSTQIKNAVQSGELATARQRLSLIRQPSIAGRFSELVDSALLQESREVKRIDAQARELDRVFKWLLPLAIALIVLVAISAAVIVSRRLSYSLRALHDAALAFTGGNLAHQLPHLPEREFEDLGRVMAQMAQELSARRAAEERSHASLEALVRERTEALEASNERLEQLDKGRRRLFADISHELRTPLTIIRGESEFALRASHSEAQYREVLERVAEQSIHTARLVDDLLFLARAEEGQSRIEMRSVRLEKLVAEVGDDFVRTAKAKGLSIRQHGVEKRALVFGDSGRLRQVFAILLDNAVRYSRAETDIEISLQTDLHTATVSIRDHGVGLSEDDIAQAFDRFYRGSTASRHSHGTGLGLPVAKAIVEAHNGTITLANCDDGGVIAVVSFALQHPIKVVA